MPESNKNKVDGQSMTNTLLWSSEAASILLPVVHLLRHFLLAVQELEVIYSIVVTIVFRPEITITS